MTAVLSAAAVHHSYGPVEVLHGVTLAVEAGEILAIIGPNGSGKSTLLRVLARIISPAAGVVRLGDVDLRRVPPREAAQRIAFLPQAPEAPPEMSVEELVRRGRYPYRGFLGLLNDHDRTVIDAALARTGLARLRARALATLSGGERQRAWLALALAQEPEILLLDEPTTFLDVLHQVELLTLLRTLNAERGLTVVMVMHDLSLAARYASRALVLHEGRVVVSGDPLEVLTSQSVADVFGIAIRRFEDPAGGPAIIGPVLP